MKIFIDSAKVSEIEEAFSSGFLDGVTTNPSLLKGAVDELKAKGENLDLAQYIERILTAAEGTPVSLEVTEYTYEKMVEQGRKIYKRFNPIANNVYIKIPINPVFGGAEAGEFDGLKAIKELSGEGIPVNCTLVFTPEQALLAAKAGAAFVSPFAGRVDDYIRSQNGMQFKKSDYFPAQGIWKDEQALEDNGIISGIDLVEQIVEIFLNYEVTAEVLAASLRNARQVREAALAGADIATLPLYVIKDLVSHHKTRDGMEKFIADILPEYVEITR
ncbi:MAG: transaldolase [delta proteobacterium ML8_D]|jgi:transaldolase|nr:MAG: transaldolase [delta proteobacterium ML8_D]